MTAARPLSKAVAPPGWGDDAQRLGGGMSAPGRSEAFIPQRAALRVVP